MKEKFREVGFNKANSNKLDLICDILGQYRSQGYVLTLRQLYYQLVSRDIIPNRPDEYGKMCVLVGKARMGGIIDWDSIEDRVRVPYLPYYVHGVKNALEDTINQYRLDRMNNQDVYIEVWCEKDALSGILKRVTEKYHVKLMINRGYSSITAMYDAYNRYDIRIGSYSKEIYLLYFGDHDPSGLDMIRDIKDRLREFGVGPIVKHIAITEDQIDEYNPPPNPAKITDPRADWYISKYGDVSWEVDALPPDVLNKLLVDSIEELIDMDLYDDIVRKEENDINMLTKFADSYGN